jgi:hypothetical protein
MESPCLAALEERLKANGVDADPIHVASAILGLARTLEWIKEPGNAVQWLERLAVEVTYVRLKDHL